MRDKMQKKYQHYANKLIKGINNGIYEDELWRGRFVFHQIFSSWERFTDNSGGLLSIIIRAYDKETNKYRDFWVETAPFLTGTLGRLYWRMVNPFITEDIAVWNEEVNPYNNKKDWRKIAVDDTVWRKPIDLWIRSI